MHRVSPTPIIVNFNNVARNEESNQGLLGVDKAMNAQNNVIENFKQRFKHNLEALAEQKRVQRRNPNKKNFNLNKPTSLEPNDTVNKENGGRSMHASRLMFFENMNSES